MAYADYAYYQDVFLGSEIEKADFPALAERASDYIDYITRGKAAAADDKVKRACCALAEGYLIIQRARQKTLAGSGEVQSESVGSWSVTYRSGAEQSSSVEKSLYSIALRYLSAYMYRGGGCRCTCPIL